MKIIFGFIVALCTIKLHAATYQNCTHLYLIVEETIMGHELKLLDEVDLSLLDPSIPRHCYLGLRCDSFIENCPPRVIPTRYSYHTDLPDPYTVPKDRTASITTESMPEVTEPPAFTGKDTDIASVDTSSPVTSTVDDRVTATEAPRVIATDGDTTLTVDTLSPGTSTADDKITATEASRGLTTDTYTNSTTTSPAPITTTVDDSVIVPESSRAIATDRDTNPSVGTTSPNTPTVDDRATATEAPRDITTDIYTNSTTYSTFPVTSTDDRVTTTEVSTVITTNGYTNFTAATTPAVSKTDDEVRVTEAPKTANNTATNAHKSNSTSHETDVFNNELLKGKNKTDDRCAISVLKDNADSIMFVIVLLAIGLLACNMLCYILMKEGGRCLMNSSKTCVSDSYDVTKYE